MYHTASHGSVIWAVVYPEALMTGLMQAGSHALLQITCNYKERG